MFEPDITPLECPARSGHISDFLLKILFVPLCLLSVLLELKHTSSRTLCQILKCRRLSFQMFPLKTPSILQHSSVPPFCQAFIFTRTLLLSFVLLPLSLVPLPLCLPEESRVQRFLLVPCLLSASLPPSIPPASSVITSSPLLYSCSQTPLQHLKLQITPAPHTHTGFEFVQYLNPGGWKVFCSRFQQKPGCGG